MSTVPPSFENVHRRKPRNNTLMIVLIIFGILACGCLGLIAAAGFFGFQVLQNQVGPFLGCAVNFSSLSDGMDDYLAKNNGVFPKAENWQESLKPYVKAALEKNSKEFDEAEFMNIKVMNVDGEWGCDLGDQGRTGIAYNKAIAGKKLTDIEKQDTILFFEVKKAGKNLVLPYERVDSKDSPVITGKNRGWFTLDISGEVLLDGKEMNSTGSGVRVDINSK